MKFPVTGDALNHRLTSLPLSLWRPDRLSTPSGNMGAGFPLGGSPPPDTDIRQRLEYGRRTFQAGDRSRAFDGGYQCGCGRGSTRRTETAPPEVPRDNLSRINKSARYPFGQLSVERGQLIRQILHQTSILEIRGNHFGRECAENLMNKIQSITCRIRRDIAQHGKPVRNVLVDCFFRELCLATWKVKVERSFGGAAFFKDLDQSSRCIALNAKQPLGSCNRARAGVSLTWHAVNLTQRA